MDVGISYCNYDYVSVSTDDPRNRRKWLKLAEQHPDECEIIARPENNDGCTVIHVPHSWLSIKPPIKRRKYTEEEKQKFAEILRKARENH